MELPDPSQLLGRASEIAEALLDSAVTETESSITWQRGFNIHLQPAPDPGIYNGRAGEALFFAALGSATANRRYSDAARAAIDGVRRAYMRPGGVNELGREYGLGLTGVGSQLYVLETLARLLDDAGLQECAWKGVEELTLELIWTDERLELFWGASGLLLGLLAVADAGNDRAFTLAEECGKKLLAERILDPHSLHRAWRSYHKCPASGFAHGSTGIAHALIELHHRAPDARWLDAVTESFAFERTLLDPTSGDWADIKRDKGLKGLQCSWCHGAPGIGFARVAAAHCLGASTTAEIVDDLYVTLHRVANYPGDQSQNLCCGAFGRADFLLEAGIRLQNEALVVQSHRVIAEVLRRTKGAAFFIPNYPDAHMKPGLWQGLAGIGYQLVRLTDPMRFGSVLNLWSSPAIATERHLHSQREVMRDE